MNCGHCGDCKHWTKHDKLTALQRAPYMFCAEADVDTPNGWDDAYLVCAPDFGCVKWEPRE